MPLKEVRQLNGRIPLLGLLAIQVLIGYEWLMSGLTKVVRGGFPSGLADELTEKSDGAALVVRELPRLGRGRDR